MPEHNTPAPGQTHQAGQSVAPSKTKKPYQKPSLHACGDVRDVTMGGSPGVGDSGNGALEKPFGT